MKIIPQTTKDFGYIMIEDMYTLKELELIWSELSALNFMMNLDSQKEIRLESSALKTDIKLYTGNGISLDTVYQHRDYSPILTYNRKIFDPKVFDSLSKTHPSNHLIPNKDRTMINRYTEGDNYLPHHDEAYYTAITVLNYNPENIKGGNFGFPDYNIDCNLDTNCCVLFPSWVKHEATAVSTWDGGIRYSIAQFMYVYYD